MQELMPELMSECLPQSMSGNYLRRFTRSDVRGYVKIPRMNVKYICRINFWITNSQIQMNMFLSLQVVNLSISLFC